MGTIRHLRRTPVFLLMQMLAGNLDLTEISSFVKDLVPENKKAAAPKKKAVRAR